MEFDKEIIRKIIFRFRELAISYVNGQVDDDKVNHFIDNISECETCGGLGYRIDHDPLCDGSCQFCPTQVGCEKCLGTGVFLDHKQKVEQLADDPGDDLPF